MKKLKVIISTIFATALIAGCTKTPPKCSDEETLTLVRQIIGNNVGGSTVASEEEMKNNIKINLPKATAFDKDIHKYSCDAKLVIPGNLEIPIIYESQFDDNGQHIVSVGGLTLGHALLIRDAIIKAVKKSTPVSNPPTETQDEKINTIEKDVQLKSKEGSLCQSIEKDVFSCVSENNTIYSLCASKNVTPNSGYLQLHYKSDKGSGLVPEQEIPPSQFVTADSLMFSGGGGIYMRLKYSETMNYVVYSAIGKEFDIQGVAIEFNGKTVLDNVCKDSIASDIGPEFVEKNFIPEDTQGFEVPFGEIEANTLPENNQAETEMPPKTWSPSFNCDKASTFVEKSICSLPLLGSLDGALSENYKYMLTSNIGDVAIEELRSTQKKWMAERNKCTTTQCIEEFYRSRIDEVCEYPVISGVHPVCAMSEEIK